MTATIIPVGASPTEVHRRLQELLPIWTVYRHPTDYPHGYVARMSVIRSPMRGYMPTDLVILGDTLAAVRDALPPGLIRLDRDEEDDPHIVESWL